MNRRIISLVMALIPVLGMAEAALANDAGCGLGAVVIQKNTKLSQTLAITTNWVFFPTPFLGITFGTSGCSASGFTKNKQDAVMYAEANLNSLKVDVARGEGEGLVALSNLMGCSDTHAGRFAQKAKAQYQSLFGLPRAPVQVVDSIDAMIKNDTDLSKGCTGLI